MKCRAGVKGPGTTVAIAWPPLYSSLGGQVITMMGIEERTFQPLPENVSPEALVPQDSRYYDHYVVDGGKARITLNALVTPFEVTENAPMLDLLWRRTFRWQIHPKQPTSDTARVMVLPSSTRDFSGAPVADPEPSRCPSYLGSLRPAPGMVVAWARR